MIDGLVCVVTWMNRLIYERTLYGRYFLRRIIIMMSRIFSILNNALSSRAFVFYWLIYYYCVIDSSLKNLNFVR